LAKFSKVQQKHNPDT